MDSAIVSAPISTWLATDIALRVLSRLLNSVSTALIAVRYIILSVFCISESSGPVSI